MPASTLLVALLVGALPSLEQSIARYDALEYEAAVVALKRAEATCL